MRKFLDWLPNIWGAFQILFPGVAGAMTAWLAHFDQPLYLVIFYGSGVFAFCGLGLYAINRYFRENALFEHLRLDRTEPLLLEPNLESNSVSIMLKCTLENSSDRIMYSRLKRVDTHLQTRVNPAAELKDDVFLLPPKSKQPFQTAAIPNIQLGGRPIEGRLAVEVLYGPKPDKLRYMMTYELAPTLEIANMTEKGAQIIFVAPIVKYKHERVWVL